ncbi:MAG: hypothetical protein KatS3mg053_3437 [Candidatus Roseilinea sp.]|nr:MAG: hypothetical protein KatS3mg053_3437 [Candidatus Roseilinea sp.]
MNTTNVIRAGELKTVPAPSISIKSRIAVAWRAITRKLCALSADDVAGNPLHEAWTADGEPLDRMTPTELARSRTSRHLVVPHSRGR